MRLLKILGALVMLLAGAVTALVVPRVLAAGGKSFTGRLAAGDGALELATGLHPFDEPGRAQLKADPFQLNVFGKVAYYVGEDYVDPARVDPTKMLKASMDALQRGIAEIQV